MRHRVKLMYKLLFVFFMVISSPLYSNEFTYHCDRDDNNFSMVFDVNRIEQSIVHSHSIDKTKGEVRREDVDLEIYRWDEENDSVWTLIHSPQIPSLTIILFNFHHRRLLLQSIYNTLTNEKFKSRMFKKRSQNDIIVGDLFQCYIM